MSTIASGGRRPHRPSRLAGIALLGVLVAGTGGVLLLGGTGSNDEATRDLVAGDGAIAAPAATTAAAAVTEAAAASSAAAAAPGAAEGGAVGEGEDVAGVGAGVSARLQLGPHIAQTVQLGISVRRGGLAAAYDNAVRVAETAGGYVLSADAAGVAGGAPERATLTLRIPQARIANAMERLGALGTVTARGVQSEDLTQDVVDANSRLRHAQSIATRLEALVAEAKTVRDVLAVQDRLDAVQERIEVEQGRIDGLKAITDDATVTLELIEEGGHVIAATSNADAFGDTVGRGAERAARGAARVVAAAIVTVGYLVPLALIAGLLAMPVLLIRRRRRVPPAVVAPTSTETG